MPTTASSASTASTPPMERQCRICGEWRPLSTHYSYPAGTGRTEYYCQECYDIYKAMHAKGDNTQAWIDSMRLKWNPKNPPYVAHKPEPDRII